MASAGRRHSTYEGQDMLVKHQHSFSSDSSKLSVPMWDSSDPERAPPPLPLNPGSPLHVRPNTSAAIASAAKALEEKSRENAPSYTTNSMPSKPAASPERSLIKGAAHKRMQSLQDTTNLRDFRSMLSPAKTPERSPERPRSRGGAPTPIRENDVNSPPTSPEKTPSRSSINHEFLKDTPNLRPSSRSQHKPIWGENTPPSATMLAIQSMPVRDHLDTPTSNATNSSIPRVPPLQPQQESDNLSLQIREIANIASNLQREMAQLSRRSKDNATDLISLKEATNARDEDIRKSLRDLVNNINASSTFTPPPNPPFAHSRSNSFTSPGTPPTTNKTFSLPRITSPFFDERIGSPNPYSIEGAASVAMLEKIVREMVTKEGQERLINSLNGLFEKANQESSEAAKKVGELVEFIKQGSESRALITQGGGNGDGTPGSRGDRQSPDLGAVARATRDFNTAFGLPHDANSSKPYSSPKGADFVSADMLKVLKTIKQSISENGGMTAELKVLLQNMRGEVLGMGRDIARRFDEMTPNSSGALALTDGQQKEDIARIVREGLTELQEHMDNVLRETRLQSDSSLVSQNAVDNQEVYQVVKHALAEHGFDQAGHGQGAPIDKEALVEAVRDAYEECKPHIELQQFGLERDEILECLREGFEQYRAAAPAPSSSINREEIMDAIADALQNFNPPQPPNQAHEIREEVIYAVRECLNEFKPSMQVSAPQDAGVSRGDVLDAVREGLEMHGPNATREIEISREDLFDAVKAGMEGSVNPFGGYGEQVLNRLQELVSDMRTEFKAYSSANGRDTEQVLDAMKDGLESLRNEIESYVDRAQDVTGKDEIVDTIRSGLDTLRVDVAAYVAAGPQGDQALNRSEMIDYIRSEFEHLHEAMHSQIVPAATGDKGEVLRVLNEGFENLKVEINRNQEEPFSEDMQEAMKAEFEAVRDSILNGSAQYRDEILDTIHASLENLHVKLEAKLGGEQITPQSNDEVIKTMKEEFEHLRETLATTVVRSGAADHNDDTIDIIREHLDTIRAQMSTDQGEASEKTLGAIREEIEHLKEALGSTVVKSGSPEEKEEILETIRAGLEDIKESQGQHSENNINAAVIEAIQAELETMRKTIAANMASRADTEEILETLRLGLDDLQSHMDKKIENPDAQMRATGEILDALNDAVEGLKTDIGKAAEKPFEMDMSVNYEILSTLKEGLQSLHTEITRLKGDKQATVEDEVSTTGNEMILAEDPDSAVSREVPAAEEPPASLKREDVEKLEVAVAQLQIKIEAMDANLQNIPPPTPANEPAPGVALKEDLTALEELLKDVQAAVTVLSEDKRRDTDIIEGVAKKEDTDAIEVLLQNTKAKLDEIVLPDPETMLKKENLETIEGAIFNASEAIDKLAAKIDGEDVASKGDVAVVEVLVSDLKSALDELKAAQPSEEEQAKKATKEDVDSIGALITELKEKIPTLPEAEAVPSKADIEQVVGLIHDFRDSHDKYKECYDNDISVTAKAFDDRKTEADTIINHIAEVKSFLGEVKTEIQTKLQEGGEGVNGLKETISGLDEAIKNDFNVTADVKELLGLVKSEFERAHGSIEELKTDNDGKAQANLEKHEEIKEVIVSGLAEKLDEKFTEMMTKYDDMLVLAEAQAQKIDDKTAQQEEMMANTKAMAEELKVTVDTLGTSITGMQSSFTETTEKMTGDSSTVYTKIDEAVAKMDGNHEADKAEHQLTRDEIVKIATAVTAVQDDLTENHPKFMVTLQEVLALVNQHYEHTKTAQEAAQEQVRAAAEEQKAKAEELKESFFSGLPALLPPPAEPVEKYDDTQLHDKLDQLLGHATDASKSAVQLERLDEIHKQVMTTAAEVSEFVHNQTKLIAEGHENREKEAEEIALLLERRTVQKEQIEQDIHNLNDEKDQLRQIVESLRHEKEALQAQKSKLNADVSALEMALNIRREELQAMDSKADALERRILNGIMDHSRALLLTKGIKAPMPDKSLANKTAQDAAAMPPPSTASKGLSMAMNTRPALLRSAAQQTANPANRRILSLSQISGNTPNGAQGYSSAANSGLKRSQSVRTQPGYRKSSWGSAKRVISDNKENETLNEERESEDELEPSEVDQSETVSETGTQRRHSYGSLSRAGVEGTSMYDDSLVTPGSEDASMYDNSLTSPGTERRSSYGTGSEYTYGTGSYITGSDVGRRTSLGSTMHSTMGVDTATGLSEELDDSSSGSSHYESGDEGDMTEVPHEEEADGHSDADASSVTESAVTHERKDSLNEGSEVDEKEAELPEIAAPQEEQAVPTNKKEYPFSPGDSGLGSDLPTAALEGEQADYFRRAAEEEASQISAAQ